MAGLEEDLLLLPLLWDFHDGGGSGEALGSEGLYSPASAAAFSNSQPCGKSMEAVESLVVSRVV